MALNILVAGAAGYIGGSVLDRLIHSDGPVKDVILFAGVRSKDQIPSFAKLPVTALLLDVSDGQALTQTVLENKIDVIINTVASFQPDIVLNMIKALAERRKESGNPVHLVHSGVTTVFSAEAGWPYGEIKDSDAVYEKEKQWQIKHPVRETDLLVAEEARTHNILSYNIVVPGVYGRGTGEGRKISVNIPAYIRTAIADRIVHKFDTDSTPPHTHISDMAALYVIIVEKILQGQSIPTSNDGYYFAIAHRARQWKIMELIAESLHKREMVSEPAPRVWPSDEVAAEKLGFPVQHIRAMGTASGKQVAVNAFQLGWKPEWDEERFLGSIDDEVLAVLELDSVAPSIFRPLIKSGSGNA